MSNTIKHCLTSTESVSPLYLVQVKIWRRSFDVPPPPMEPGHPFYDNIVKDPRYKDEPSKEEFPMNEVDI